jgi:hypothetical protein
MKSGEANFIYLFIFKNTCKSNMGFAKLKAHRKLTAATAEWSKAHKPFFFFFFLGSSILIAYTLIDKLSFSIYLETRPAWTSIAIQWEIGEGIVDVLLPF